MTKFFDEFKKYYEDKKVAAENISQTPLQV